MAVIETIKEAVGLEASSETPSTILILGFHAANTIYRRSSVSTSNVRSESTTCIQGQLRTPVNTTEPMPI